MSTALQVFEFEDHVVRTAGTFEAPLFNIEDVCAVLQIDTVRNTVNRLDPDDVEMVHVERAGSIKKAAFVTEAGLYSLIFTSKKQNAKAFKKWVTSEVLPEIRKRGYYNAIEVHDRKQTERLLAECFPNLPKKSEPIFRELISALVKIRRETGATANPPWARMLAKNVYEWAFKIDGQQQFRRAKNPNPGPNSTDHSMFSDIAEVAVRRVLTTGCDTARAVKTWEQWKLQMELMFGRKALQLPIMVPVFHTLPENEPAGLLPERRDDPLVAELRDAPKVTVLRERSR